MPENKTLIEFLERWVEKQPQRILYRFLPDGEGEPEVVSYSEMAQRAKAIASRLQSYRGQRALMLFHSGLEFLEAFLACLYAGVIAVPAYPPRKNHNLARLKAIIEDCEPRLVLTTEKVLRIAEPMFHQAFGGLESRALTGLTWMATETTATDFAERYDNQLPQPQDIAFLQYTSGSTGNPKGVMVSHHNLVANERIIQQALNTGPEMHLVGWIPLFHDLGLIGIALHPLYIGVDALLMPPAAFLLKPYRWLKAISDTGKQGGGVVTAAPNFAFQMCVDRINDEQRDTLDLSSLKVAAVGAEPVRAATLDAFCERFAPVGFSPDAFSPCYGLAEATLMVTGASMREPVVREFDAAALKSHKVVAAPLDGQSLVSSGRNQLGQKLALVDPISHQILSENKIGEIWVQGDHISQGYWSRPTATAETFQAHTATGSGPFMRTGDLGAYVDGELYITGRLKDLIILRARNLYPSDIEYCVENSNEALRTDNCAAFAMTVNNEEHLVILIEVERAKRMSLDVDAVMADIRRAVSAEFEVLPHAIVLLKPGSILKTSSGKIQRGACRTAYLNRSLSVIAAWQSQAHNLQLCDSSQADVTDFTIANADSLQQWMLRWIAQHLQKPVENLDPSVPFTELGIARNDAMQLMDTLESNLNRSIDQKLIWEYDSVAKLAPVLLQQGSGGDVGSEVTEDTL